MDASSVSDTDSKSHTSPGRFTYQNESLQEKCCEKKFSNSLKWPWLHYREENDSVSCYTCLKAKFDQPGFQTYKNVLLKAENKESYDDDIEFITQLYGSDLNLQQLKLHLNILSSNLPQSSIAYDLSSIVEFIKKLSPIQKALIPQVHCLVSLILVMPATNATSERSFSALRRVKTFLRTTMTTATKQLDDFVRS